jgi:Tfp pilus assembly protein PilF
MGEGATAKTRLSSWKEVAAFFQRTERTVRRWEVERGLPIRRLPGAVKSRIFAEVAELEAWRDSEGRSGAPDATPDMAKAPDLRRRVVQARWAQVLAGFGAVLALAAVAMVLRAPISAYATHTLKSLGGAAGRPPSLEAQRLYVQGTDDWARRTPASLNRAVDEFNAAIARDPDYAEAWLGLAKCYNLMPEYTQTPGARAYPLARDAARRALALNDRLSEAHSALAFAENYGFFDAATARREFAQAITLDPASETAHHWYATFLASQGEAAGATREIDRALALSPRSLPIQTDRAFILYAAGRKAEAIAALEALEAQEATSRPFRPLHAYLAAFYLLGGRDRDYLRESEIAAQLTHNLAELALTAAARRGFAEAGRRGMLEAMLQVRLRQYLDGSGSAYTVGSTYGLLGDLRRAADYLKLSIDRREVPTIGFDPAYGALRNGAASRLSADPAGPT